MRSIITHCVDTLLTIRTFIEIENRAAIGAEPESRAGRAHRNPMRLVIGDIGIDAVECRPGTVPGQQTGNIIQVMRVIERELHCSWVWEALNCSTGPRIDFYYSVLSIGNEHTVAIHPDSVASIPIASIEPVKESCFRERAQRLVLHIAATYIMIEQILPIMRNAVELH